MPFRGQSDAELARAAAGTRPDAVPADAADRETWARGLARTATVYGLPAVWQHDLMRRELWGEDPTPASTFRHERRTASPAFSSFRVPNVDTLYSSAWVDLTGGPVVVDLPDVGERYLTLQLLDAFSNACNISRRTVGDARRVRLVPPGADPAPLSGVLDLHVDSPVMWVLMRLQVTAEDASGDGEGLAVLHRLQDQVRFGPAPGASRLTPERSAGDVETDWRAFLSTLDAALRLQGHPASEQALVDQLRPLGVLAAAPFDDVDLDDATCRGIEAGYSQALALLDANRAQLGVPTPAGWTRVKDKGRHGTRYLGRAIMNFVGLGANVEDENTSFNTYVDHAGEPLEGRHSYELVLDDPPRTDAFWSITLYEAETGYLHDAPGGVHSVGSASGGRSVAATGRIVVGPEPIDDAAWLPAPTGRFFLVLRTYSPGPEVVGGAWVPPALHRLGDPGDPA